MPATDFALVRVHDMYGNRMNVRQDMLDAGKRMLRVYHPRTRQPFSKELGDKDGECFLLRSNICEHDLAQFVEVAFPDGTSFKECPICREVMEAKLAKYRAEADAANAARSAALVEAGQAGSEGQGAPTSQPSLF